MKRPTIIGALCALAISAFAFADGINIPFSFPASPCTNQFIRSIAASTGVGTCASVAIGSDVSGLGTNVATFLATPSSANLIGALTDETGTGAAVFGTAPVITTPRIIGVTDGSSATAGDVGERLDATAALTSVPLTTATPANITSKSLTAGDWEVSCTGYFLTSATTTVNTLHISLGTVSATSNSTVGKFASIALPNTVLGGNDYWTVVTPNAQVNITTPTTYYCVAVAGFGVSTLTVGGSIHAVRVR